MRSAPDSIHFHYLLWEDWRNGLYGTASRDVIIGECVGLLSNQEAFVAVLNEVGQEWPISAAQNLSDVYRNHQPWCGRAACCYEFGATIPEVNTAWGLLTPEQKIQANLIADAFTYSWRNLNVAGQIQWPI